MTPDPRLLMQRWVHSHEEDRGEEMVFRPGTYAFGPSRGRRSMEFQADGKMSHGGPGPVDRPVTKPGGWTLDGAMLTVTAPGNEPEQFEISSVDAEKLVLRKRPA